MGRAEGRNWTTTQGEKMDDYRESEASRRASGWTYPHNPPDPPNPEADSIRELHKILFDAPPPPNEDPEKTRWRVMTMLKGLKAEQNEEALAALQQITAALNTSGGQTPATVEQSPPATTPSPPMAGRLGQVLAWTANTIAVALLVIGAVAIFAAWDNMSRENTPALVWQSEQATDRDRAKDKWHFVVVDPSKPWTEYQQASPSTTTILRVNVLQAFLSAALLVTVTVIWGIGRAIRYVLTGPAPRGPWRIRYRRPGEGVLEDWALQRRDVHGGWITAAVYRTKQAAEAALRSIAR